MRFAQLVIGPAGSGKSTYCHTLACHGETINRNISVINLDPAADDFRYQPLADVRELIHLDDVMEDEELRFGPNGGLVFCLEHLMENPGWLEEQLGDFDDDYILFDCPGQLELYTHLDVMKKLVSFLLHLNFKVVSVFLLDSSFMIDASKFISGVMATLSAMVNLETPHINILTKIDLLNPTGLSNIEKFTDPDLNLLLEGTLESEKWGNKHRKLTEAISNLIDDVSLVKFLTLNPNDEENINDVLFVIDSSIQYGEDADVKVKDFDELEPNEEDTKEV